MNYITNDANKVYDKYFPLPVEDVSVSSAVGPAPVETVNFVVGAAGFKGIVNLAGGPVMNALGDKVGSFWRSVENKMFESAPMRASITSITETDGSAAVVISVLPYGDSQPPNLEQLFEVSTGNSRAVIVLTDPTGNELVGFIRDIAKNATNTIYTINVATTLAGGTQNWIGSQSNFVSTDATKCGFQIYSYESSFAWVTGTVLPMNQEKEYTANRTDFDTLNEVLTANGDWCLDYMRGRVLYRKASTGTSDTCSYKVRTPFFFSQPAKLLSNTKTLSANNTTANVPVFRVTGDVRIIKLYGIVTTVLGSNITAAYWRLNDQTAQANITLNTGTTLSSAPVGSSISKNGLATAALVLKSSATGTLTEPTTLETVVKSEFEMNAKSGANTDIEFTYTTTNTPTSGAIQFFVEYQALSADGSIAAV